MSNIIKPVRWWDWVSPQGEQEMIPFLRAYMGKGKQFRTPKRMWEDLWRLKRGDMNHIMGVRKAPTITNFKGPKYQKGIICAAGVFASGGTEPDFTDITNTESNVSPTRSRTHVWWNSDGEIRFYTGTAATPTYAALTTQSGDANNHTGEWWPDEPETNEGLNWDIRYTNENDTVLGNVAWKFYDTVGVANRVVDTWYLLDTVSNDAGDLVNHGSYGTNRSNGTAKNPTTGTAIQEADIEIRATGSGSAVASNTTSLTVIGTSDKRLKDNIRLIGYSDSGIRLYTWTWNKIAQDLGIDDPTIGVIAQEHPYATFVGDHGYLKVNYSKIFS
jgi:hypothetical protein